MGRKRQKQSRVENEGQASSAAGVDAPSPVEEAPPEVESQPQAEESPVVEEAKVSATAVEDTAPGMASENTDPPGTDPHGEKDVEVSTESIIEAILMATDAPLPAARIAEILGTGDAKLVRKHVEALNEQYAATGRSFRIEEIAKGFQILTLPVYNGWLRKVLHAREETKLTGAALETLAIIAYKQPVLRAEIEAIRGVAAGDIINRLREQNLVKIVGRAEEIGRPMLYGTSKRFLEVFGLASLDDLPKVEELAPPKSPEGVEAKPALS